MPVYIAHKIVKPDIDACMFTESSRKQYENISYALHNDIDEIHVSPFDFNEIYSKAEKYVNEYLNKEDEIIFDFTGGTKIQSLALFNYAMKNGHKAIYINTQNQEYILFHNFKETERNKFNVAIDPKTYLALGGFDVIIESFDKYESLPFAKEFFDVMENAHNYLRNILAGKPGKINTRSKITISKSKADIKLYANGKLLYSYSNPKLNKNSRKMLNHLFGAGTWLEYLAYRKIKDSGKFDFIEPNLKIPYNETQDNQTSKNEIDVLAIRQTIPYVFECKTASISQDEIAKLTSLRRTYFGRYCKLIFVGLKKLNETKIEKLKDNNIEYVKFDDLDDYLNNLNFSNNPSLK